MSNFNNGGNLPAGLTKITNTTGRPEQIYTHGEIQQTWDNLKNAMAPVLKDLTQIWDELRQQGPFLNLIAQQHAIDNGERYWYDINGQPRRNPTMRPLLQNGKKPR